MIWESYDKTIETFFKLVNGKSVVLWGFDSTTFFVEHIFALKGRKVDLIIEDGSLNPKIPILRSVEVEDELNPRQHLVFISGETDTTKEEYLNSLGFEYGKNYFYTLKWFASEFKVEALTQLSYYDYLEKKYGANIIAKKSLDDIERARDDCWNYSTGIGYAIAEAVNEFVFDESDAVFDYGTGKGGALAVFNKFGVGKLGGVEYDSELYGILADNYKLLGLDSTGIIHGDATLIKEPLDDYNYFFMYNPFEGETFRKVIDNLENSYKRNPRKMTLIYSGPYCHKMVVENGVFALTKKIKTDYSLRYVRVYTTE